MDDQLSDLQSAEDADAEEDFLNNNSENDEDMADHMREFHVSACSRAMPVMFNLVLTVISLRGRIFNDMARLPSSNIPPPFRYRTLAFLKSKILYDVMSSSWTALIKANTTPTLNGPAICQAQWNWTGGNTTSMS